VTSWAPQFGSYPDAYVIDGSNVYVGGAFYTVNGYTRSYLAQVDATTGNPTAWNPNPNYIVSAMTMMGSDLVAAGYFTYFGQTPQSSLAYLDKTTGNLTSRLAGYGNITVMATDGTNLALGGTMSSAGGYMRNNAASIDLKTGRATLWDPQA